MNRRVESASLLNALLLHVFCDRITAPNADAGIERLVARAGRDVNVDAWRAAVSDALTAGYLHDPVRLPEGALQCHWHLELTPLGVEAALRLRASERDRR